MLEDWILEQCLHRTATGPLSLASGEPVKRTLKAAVILMGLALAAGAWGIVSLLRHGLSAREQPTRIEAFVARHLRHIAVPRAARDAANPVAPAGDDVDLAGGGVPVPNGYLGVNWGNFYYLNGVNYGSPSGYGPGGT